MDTLPFIIMLAAVWHVGVTLLQYARSSRHTKPQLSKLLLHAEIEVLRTLRGELKRLARSIPKHEQKLREVDHQLGRLENAAPDA